MLPLTRLVRPTQSNRKQSHDFLDALVLSDTGSFQVESPPFQTLKQALNFPTPCVYLKRLGNRLWPRESAILRSPVVDR